MWGLRTAPLPNRIKSVEISKAVKKMVYSSMFYQGGHDWFSNTHLI